MMQPIFLLQKAMCKSTKYTVEICTFYSLIYLKYHKLRVNTPYVDRYTMKMNDNVYEMCKLLFTNEAGVCV